VIIYSIALTNVVQNKIENDASVDDVRKDERAMQSILTHTYSSTGQGISQELRESIEALQRQVHLHFDWSFVVLSCL
jgi:hypothetical protein